MAATKQELVKPSWESSINEEYLLHISSNQILFVFRGAAYLRSITYGSMLRVRLQAYYFSFPRPHNRKVVDF